MVYSLLLLYQTHILWFLRNFFLFKIEEPSETSYLSRSATFFIKIHLEWHTCMVLSLRLRCFLCCSRLLYKMMSSHVLSRLYCVIWFCRPGKQIKPFMSNSGFFFSKLKRAFWDVEHFWMTSAVLSEAALLWCVYVRSVAAVSPTKNSQ